MSNKINVASPLVILHGDEMAQVAFEHILEKFVTARLDIQLKEIDPSLRAKPPVKLHAMPRVMKP